MDRFPLEKKKYAVSPVHIIMLSFLGAILIGSLLLSLPISAKGGRPIPYIDALFTATTSVCVTGLVTVPTVSAWSAFGHVVILLLIQIGGLGVVTCSAGVMLALQKKMGLSERLLLQDAFNLNTLSGLSAFVLRVIRGTFLVEGAGALCYMTVFVPRFGLRGVWISVFTAVSAFCNAGIDIMSENSLAEFATDPVVNFVTMALIVLGGIGFVVWWDVLRMLRRKRDSRVRFFSGLTLGSKLALSSTAVLIVGGALLFLLFEYQNPATFGRFSFPEKLQAALFQSVTTRTAGFASVPQKALTDGSVYTALVLMFIGGSPVGTAGGVKTVTVFVLAATAAASVKNRDGVSLFHRRIPPQTLKKAVAVVGMSFVIFSVSTLLLSAVTNAPLTDVLYETVSATATVGLTRDLTPHLPPAGKLIIIVTMYLGRVGPISLAVAFRLRRESENIVKNPEEDVSVG